MARPKWSSHINGHAVSSADVKALKPFRDKTIPVSKLVPCTIHNAVLGEPCRSAAGKLVGCQVRRRLAIRKLNEQEEK